MKQKHCPLFDSETGKDYYLGSQPSRAKNIKNKAKINQERSVTELKNLLAKAEKEIARLQNHINALEDEVAVLKGGEPIHRKPISVGSSDDKTPITITDTKATLLLQGNTLLF